MTADPPNIRRISTLLRNCAFALLLPIHLAGCSGARLLDTPLQTSSIPYHFAGHDLDMHTASPSGDARRLPILLLLEGDGGGCQAFSPKLWQRYLRRMTGHYTLVRPRNLVNAVCETPAWGRLDFLHRLAELSAQVAALRQVWPDRPLVLLGHSAGAHLAMLYAADHPKEIAGIINLSGGVDALDLVISALYPNGIGHRKAAAWTQRMRANRSSDEPDDTRSPKFFAQMLDLPVGPLWRGYRGPLLLLHGERDEAVPASLVRKGIAELPKRANLRARIDPAWDHDLLYRTQVYAEIDRWLAEAVNQL
jgi:pimeloyl-ACP methyl ester carboxylesterase